MSVSLSSLALAEPRLDNVLLVIACWCVLWWRFIPWYGRTLVREYVDRQPWKSRWIAMQRSSLKSRSGVELDDASAYDFALCFQGVILQHGVGGLLCVPYMLGLGPARLQTSLAVQGSLCEAGWEVMDVLTRAWDVVYGGEAGRRRNPRSLLMVLALHHSMSLLMAVPVALYYRDVSAMHEATFLLQGAAFVASLAQSWAYALDLKSRAGAVRMRGVAAFTLATLLWSRGFGYVVVSARVLRAIWQMGSYLSFAVSLLVCGLMSFLNYNFIADSARRVQKFWGSPLPPLGAGEIAVSGVSGATPTCCLVRRASRSLSDAADKSFKSLDAIDAIRVKKTS
jgi:hypothetical protein